MASKILFHILFVHFLISSLSLVLGDPIYSSFIGSHEGQEVANLVEIKRLLRDLGYLNYENSESQAHENDDFFDDILESAVKDYQTFYILNVTGTLDADTVALMGQPRCGVADVLSQNVSLKFHASGYPFASHYVFGPNNNIWLPSRRNLTYSVLSNSLQPFHIQNTIYAVSIALKQWATIVGFNFTYIENYRKADVKFSFQRRDHGDGHPFDGPGKVLAHAFYPTIGKCHFDADDKWSLYDGAPDAHDLETVALHEIGHILGLAHSNLTSAVMYPYINYGVRKGLSQDDIQGIKALYKIK